MRSNKIEKRIVEKHTRGGARKWREGKGFGLSLPQRRR